MLGSVGCSLKKIKNILLLMFLFEESVFVWTSFCIAASETKYFPSGFRNTILLTFHIYTFNLFIATPSFPSVSLMLSQDTSCFQLYALCVCAHLCVYDIDFV